MVRGSIVVAAISAMISCSLTSVALAGESPQHWDENGEAFIARNSARISKPGAAGSAAKNVILFLGDGMGLSTITAARIFAGQQAGGKGEDHALSFETLPHVGLVKTYNTNQQVPDSAGTMSAIMTGVKTKAGVISINQNAVRGDCGSLAGAKQITLLEKAEDLGLSTGIVTTARLTHATPAATYAHSPERNWESDADMPSEAIAAGCLDIAQQLIAFKHGDGLEVALGGGRQKFLPEERDDPEGQGESGEREDGRDLTQEWQQKYPQGEYVWNREQFEAVDASSVERVLGLFEASHMKYDAERRLGEKKPDGIGEPSLSEMTTKAIELLSKNDKGFFLMVEGGRIDHGHHAGNAYRALTETVEFSNAVQVALSKVNLEETMIIVTADHSHVFTMGGYPTRGNPILGKVRGNDESGEPSAKLAEDDLGLPYTTLGYANGPGYTGASYSLLFGSQPEGSKSHPHSPTLISWLGTYRGISDGRPDLGGVKTDAPDYLPESAVPMVGETHAGEDVSVYAAGPGSKLIGGVMEQNVLFHVMLDSLEKNPSCQDSKNMSGSAAAIGGGCEVHLSSVN